jgi:dihydropteroate synthase
MKVIGILNITPDSFSDGSDYFCADKAAERALQIQQQGADIIDIGAQSTRPGSERISANEEIARLKPFFEKNSVEIPISVDTYYPEVAKFVLEKGASIINNVNGFRNPEMFEVAAKYNCSIIIMHSSYDFESESEVERKNEDIIDEIKNFFREKVKQAFGFGIDGEHIILDPGVGFSGSHENDLKIIANAEKFKEFGLPVLIGASRKSFIETCVGKVPPKERLAGSLAAHCFTVNCGADYVRTHDVNKTIQALRVNEKIQALRVENGKKTTVFLALGTNLGDKRKNIEDAVDSLGRIPKTKVISVSSVLETEPFEVPDEQDNYFNCCAKIETELLPHTLLGCCLGIESAMGRKRIIRHGSRIIDIDLLLYGDEKIETSDLSVPHPEMHRRDFVTKPLSEIL